MFSYTNVSHFKRLTWISWERNKIRILFLRQFVWFWERHRPIKRVFCGWRRVGLSKVTIIFFNGIIFQTFSIVVRKMTSSMTCDKKSFKLIQGHIKSLFLGLSVMFKLSRSVKVLSACISVRLAVRCFYAISLPRAGSVTLRLLYVSLLLLDCVIGSEFCYVLVWVFWLTLVSF